MAAGRIRILLADDHHLVRHGIASLLESVPNIYIAGEAGDGRELITKYFDLRPDVVVTDISMPGLSGIEAAEKILLKDKDARILFLSVHDSMEIVYKVLRAGGLGLINKTIAKGDLVYAIETVNSGERYFGSGYTEEKLSRIMERYDDDKEEIAGDGPELTDNDIEILKLICEGLQSAEIAEKMNLSKKTIDKHRAAMMKKLNVTNTAQLIRYAYKNNILA
ncbi:MAG TPA: response regulator transcription factor [Ignavibacteriales bacterium]|nr:response regulator transcription factor [Ignavibacteriales bacterium]